ncbi:class I SAM-dependent methyltransferase [uncultured Jatrophihabitans sp.]|uniref:class I SAM-dependent methyltransferase n=1 Tax=uncultured Jatrophihabitans sp. TaxID=1610747 RepID=UPI0035CB2B1E
MRVIPSLPSVSGRPSRTAQATALGRALELSRDPAERIVSDPLAPFFLPPATRALLAPLYAAGPVVRLAERTPPAAISTSALCRHRFIDEHLLAALPDVEQVLLLGAGYDARAYRFANQLGDRTAYEVDLPAMARRKASVVAAHADLFGPAQVVRVETDFARQSLADRLADAAFPSGVATFVVWEGVSMYLAADAVRATLAALREVCGPGSMIAMDCWQRAGERTPLGAARRAGEQSLRLLGEPVRSALPADRAPALLDQHGFEVADLAQAAAMTRRFATGGRRCDRGMYVLAARRR